MTKYDIVVTFLTLVSVVMSTYALWVAYNLKKVSNYIYGQARAQMKAVRAAGVEKQAERRYEETEESAKGDLLETILDTVPFSRQIVDNMRQKGYTDDQLFRLFTNEETLRGFFTVGKVATETGSWLKELIGDLGGKKKDPKDEAEKFDDIYKYA